MENYRGVLTFDDRGPIKTVAQLTAINSHNTRAKPEPHCDPKGPKPLHIFGSGNLISDLKARLTAHGLDLATLRSNAAVAFEVILSASHGYFTDCPMKDRPTRLGHWIAQAIKFVRKMWGENRIVSMVLHLDEYTPHFHVVITPLVKKVFARWPERGECWTLNGKVVSGPGEYQRAHDEYAHAMAPLGIERGVARSGAKYRPYSAEIAELEEQKAIAVAATVAADKAAKQSREEADRSALNWHDEFNRQAAIKADLEARAAYLMQKGLKLQRDQTALSQAWRDLNAGRQDTIRIRSEAEADRARANVDRVEAAEERRIAESALDALQKTIGEALAFRKALLLLPLEELPPEAVEVLRLIPDFERAAELTNLPANDIGELPIDLQQRFVALQRGSAK